ncbi:OmpA family protein [Ahniella affigens]|uniref:OmpA family protein n=1 Tax=Ahniella affigens TaxID=2021234 RepID=A0A2P1PXV9_9GAMM|nr:OmpA family protein [Ahniella affigens]AVP99675.1 OmpA family protein [Ahniella affigens]
MSRLIWICFACLLSGFAHADFGLPPEVKLPAQVGVSDGQELLHEDLAEASFQQDATGAESVVRRGEHFKRWLRYTPAAGEPALGFYNGSEERIFNAVAATLKQAGWQQVYVDETKASSVFHYQKPGRELWLRMDNDAPQAYVGLELIVPASVVQTWQHPVPKATAEAVASAQNFPYLNPMPGSSAPEGARADGPLDVSLAFGANASTDPVLVGSAVQTRSYQGPKTLSTLQFMTEQRAALKQAGWQLLFPKDDADHETGLLIAHYQQQGRNLWVRMSIEFGARYAYQVVDLGAEDWAAALKKDCSLPIYGVQFDTNQATLKSASESVLQKALATIQAVPTGVIEVQGHTDAVGDDASNQALSDRRAKAVLTWLTSHGVPLARLQAKGYGETQPIADNDSDTGRARNRRVALHLAGCSKP